MKRQRISLKRALNLGIISRTQVATNISSNSESLKNGSKALSENKKRKRFQEKKEL